MKFSDVIRNLLESRPGYIQFIYNHCDIVYGILLETSNNSRMHSMLFELIVFLLSNLTTESDTAESNSELCTAVYQCHCPRDLERIIVIKIDTTEGSYYIMQILLLQ